MTNRMVHVRRTIIVEYDVEREAYEQSANVDGLMTDAEIEEFEQAESDDPGAWIEDITSETVEVTFS